VIINEEPPEALRDEQRERVARVIGFKLVRTVFTLSKTEGPDLPPAPTPVWDVQQALGKLGIREAAFDSADGNIQGYSRGVEFAISPLAVNHTKTVFHQLGHIILGHTLPHSLDEYAAHRGMMEFQAEVTAYLVMNELELMDEDTASHSRGYIAHWLKGEQPPNKAIQQVFRAADAILKTGRLPVAAY
jgi:hypothetical protein